MSNQAIIDNLEMLLAAVKAQPEDLFNLGAWSNERECGTVFCIAGLAATMPVFQAQGMGWSDYGVPTVGGTSVWNDSASPLFGEDSMYGLFHASGSGRHDTKLGFTYQVDEDGDVEFVDCTDKELAIARLEYRIKEYKNANEGK